MDPNPTVSARRLCAIVVFIIAAGPMCASSVAPDAVARGQWGGQHVTMEVTASGATLEFDCAHGRIDEPIALDTSGRFDVRGTYAQERGGPVRETEDDRTRPVRFTGRVTGKTMSLTIAPMGGGDSLGTFALEQGKSGVIRKCL